MNKLEVIELISKIDCALTHDISTCGNCKKCGSNSAEIRVELIKELHKLLELDSPFGGN